MRKNSERMKQLIDLNKNSQILLREKSKQDIIPLEEHFQDLDIKLEEVNENMRKEKTNRSLKDFSANYLLKMIKIKCELYKSLQGILFEVMEL